MGLATVLAVEGTVFYNSCSVCSSKVDLLPDSNRGWCKACRACTASPNKRYRLSLQVNEHFKTVQVIIFGHAANELFGCSANEFFKKLSNSNCSEAQMKVITERTLLGEMIRITRSGDGKSVTKVTFAVANNTSRIVDKIEQSFTTERSAYSPCPLLPSTPLRVPLLKTLTNSTPLFSQPSTPVTLGDDLSPIVNQVNKTTSSDSSYTKQSERRGKRRRCRVQCMVVDPLTQDSLQTQCHVIQPPDHVIQPPDHVIQPPDRMIQPPDLLRRMSLKSSSTESLLSEDEGRREVIDQLLPIKSPKFDRESSPTQGLLKLEADPRQELGRTHHESDYDLEFDDTPSIELPPDDTPITPLDEPMESDGSLFGNSDKENKSHDSDDFDSFEVGDVIQELEPPAGSNSSHSTNTISNSNPRDDVIGSEHSQEDLFDDISSCLAQIPEPSKIPESPIRKPKREFDWGLLNEMSSQEISKHFDFRLSDTDEDKDKNDSDDVLFSDSSNQSEELF